MSSIRQISRTRSDQPSGPHSSLYNGHRVPSPGIKQPGPGVTHPPPPLSSAEVKKDYSYTSLPPLCLPGVLYRKTLEKKLKYYLDKFRTSKGYNAKTGSRLHSPSSSFYVTLLSTFVKLQNVAPLGVKENFYLNIFPSRVLKGQKRFVNPGQ
jgi:hypothetical protein